MTCPHTETTAVLAAFGEAPLEFESHLAECDVCRITVQEHTVTLAALAPLENQEATKPSRWSPPSVVFMIAAAALLIVQFTASTAPGPVPADSPNPFANPSVVDADPFADPLDDDLASLEVDLALYALEES